MAITKVCNEVQINEDEKRVDVLVICPECKERKTLKLPQSVINKSKQLTTVSISKGSICNHHFQAFLDQNFKVRGYQKVDYEFEKKIPSINKLYNSPNEKDAHGLFKNLILEENYVEYKPKSSSYNTKYNHKYLENLLKLRKNEISLKNNSPEISPVNQQDDKKQYKVNKKIKLKSAWKNYSISKENGIINIKKEKKHKKQKDLTLKEIYEEFWEFIEDDNEEFREFIIIDKRRKRSYATQMY